MDKVAVVYTNRMKCHVTIRRDEILKLTTAWMELELYVKLNK